MSNSNNNSNENETNEDKYTEDTYEEQEEQEEQEEHDEIDIPLIKIPDEIPSRKSRHREPAREREKDRNVRKLYSKPPGKSSLKLQESNEKYTGSESAKESAKDSAKESAKDSSKDSSKDSRSFFSKYRWYILILFILLCIGLYFLWTKKLKMMFQSGGNVSTNSSNQTLDLNLLDSMNKNI